MNLKTCIQNELGAVGRRVALQAFALAIAALGKQSLGQLAAFPGAQGFGADATGGRGGSIYVVTNLNSSGAGSFEDAVSQSNRIIVFAVGGYVDMSSAISCASNLTILGQTAPGQGIAFEGHEISFTNSSNCIVQYIRAREGSTDTSAKASINLGDSTNMILDHIDAEFSQYDNIDAVGANSATDNLTLQNSLIADPIKAQQFNMHTEGNNTTYLNNIFANGEGRSVLSKANAQFVNNVVYDYGYAFTTGTSEGVYSYDIINNDFIAGPSTNDTADAFYQLDNKQSAYSSGNVVDGNKNGVLDGTVTPATSGDQDSMNTLTSEWSPTTKYLPTLSATAAYNFDVAHAGALYPNGNGTFSRDQVDTQILSTVTSLGTTGEVTNEQDDDGLSNDGFGILTNASAGASTLDTVPFTWLMSHGLSTTNAAQLTMPNALGYDMIEEYAQQVGDQYASQTATSGDWATTTWSATTPGIYDHALIRGSGTANGAVTIGSSDADSAFTVSIGGNGPAAGEVLNMSGGSLTVQDTIYVGDQNNGTLMMTGGTIRANNVQLGDTVWNANGSSSTTYTGTLILNGGVLTTEQVVLGGGSPGSWTTGGSINWSGGTLQSIGQLNVNAPATLGAGGGILDTNSGTATISGVISGAGGFTVIGGGTATVSNASSNFTGNIVVNGATLINTGAVNSLNPTTGGLGNGQTVRRTITVNNGGTLSLNIGNTFGGATSTPQVTTIINQGGVVVTAVPSGGGGGGGDATALGNIILNGGTLTAGNGYSTLYQAICLAGSVTVGGTVASTINTNATNTTANGVMLGSNTVFSVANVTGNSNPSLTVSDRLTWLAGGTTGGGFTKSGAGVMLLTGVNNYTGTTTASAGTLQIGNGTSGSISNSSAITVSGGTLAFDEPTGSIQSNNISNSGTVAGVETTGITNTLSGDISGNGSLSQTGAGTTILSGTNSYSGLTMMSAGTLQYQNSAAMSSSSQLTMGNGTTAQLRADGNMTFTTSNFNPSGGATVTLNVGAISTGSGNTLTLNSTSAAGVGGNTNQTMTWNVTGNNSDQLMIAGGNLFFQNTSGQTLVLNPTTANLTVASNLTSGTTAATLSLSGTSGNNIFSGNISNTTGTVSVTKSSTSTWTITGSNSYAGTTMVSAGDLILASANAFPTNTALNIASGALMTIANHSTNATYVPQMSSLLNSGTIDITNNALLVKNGSIGAITSEVALAYNHGAWNGTNASSGVITSSLAASNTSHLTSVGVATGLTSFEGLTVPSTDVLVKYTYDGDALLTGSVTAADYLQIDNAFSYNQANPSTLLTGWYNGDFNYDGVINGDDYTLIDNAFNSQESASNTSVAAGPTEMIATDTAQIAGAGSSAVPEPATLGLIGIGALGLLSRHGRHS